MQEKILKDSNSKNNICSNNYIFHLDADTGSIAIALLHESAVTLKSDHNSPFMHISQY